MARRNTMLQWDASLETGVAALDWQRMEFVGFLRRLEYDLAFDRAAFGRLPEQLLAYVQHLSFEEQQMLALRYPRYGSHKHEHDILRGKVAAVAGAMASGSGTAPKMLASLVADIAEHIFFADRNQGTFFRAPSGETVPAAGRRTPLDALLIPGTPETASALTHMLDPYDVALHPVADLHHAYLIMNRRKVDAAFVSLPDCREAAVEVVRHLRCSPSNGLAAAIGLTNDGDGLRLLDALCHEGVTSFVCTPVRRRHIDQLMGEIHARMLEERLSYQRVRASFPVVCSFLSRGCDLGTALDISARGMCVRLKDALPAGEDVNLNFSLLDGGDAEPFFLVGRVARVDEACAHGVAFASLPDGQEARIGRWVDASIDRALTAAMSL